ncbi:hypothetical protein GUJ93_ZPchr0002g25335 [Zizania palustris]|uniref:Uncharacterized protein n=1 Tax=Zizania palustris TaxID=103762 RepID=A0A8J5RSH7_ZIZPA|nr:hypothetical protein GUJ93_ZPchr0002g25335 [Zizania palustris]
MGAPWIGQGNKEALEETIDIEGQSSNKQGNEGSSKDSSSSSGDDDDDTVVGANSPKPMPPSSSIGTLEDSVPLLRPFITPRTNVGNMVSQFFQGGQNLTASDVVAVMGHY